MTINKLSSGTVHTLPKDVREFILANPKTHAVWEDITPLARNEWICWITSAKKEETRKHRIEVMRSKMASGMRRPCCWVGCSHR